MTTNSFPNSLCKRCGQPFKPWSMGADDTPCQCCPACAVRNLHDFLGLPTPPELVDRHTVRPTLSQWEYDRELRKPTPDDEP